MSLRGTRALVVGLAESGLAAVEALATEGAEVVVSETLPREALGDRAARAESLGARVLAGGHEPAHLDGIGLVVTSPGVPDSAPILRTAVQHGLEIWSELELGARIAMCPYIVVTGTNGKTTTTELIAEILRADGRDAIACGNVGHPFSRAAREGHEALVVEASSFQLRFHRSLAPRVSLLLNLAPDHLDWHGSFAAYADAKRRVYANQHGADTHVGNLDDPHAAAVSREAPCRLAWFGLSEPDEGAAGYVDGRLLVRWNGAHDLGAPPFEVPALLADGAAAALAAIAFGVDPPAAAKGIGGFSVPPHRGQVVAEVGGVLFVDDSKATNPHAALASLAGREGVVLIAGGRGKGVDLTPLASAAPRLAGVVAIGEAAGEIEAIFEGLVRVRRAASIEEATGIASQLAPLRGTVLLAPACASQDMFEDYRERGERFAAAARGLATSGGPAGSPRTGEAPA